MSPRRILVVGAGPAGLAAAAALRRAARALEVLVLDRDDAAGGLPRFCHHPGFGLGYSHRVESGPGFARRLLADAAACGVALETRATVLRLLPGPTLQVASPAGLREIEADAVLVATGIREAARGQRLVPGDRPERGLLTTGLLQQLVARGLPLESRRLAVVGSEHVSFSALLTARRGGARVTDMIEEGPACRSLPGAALLARLWAGTRLHRDTRVLGVRGREQVEALLLRQAGRVFELPCDGVVFTGGWTPDSVLLAESGAAIDPATGGPVTDAWLQTTLPQVFAAGNVRFGVRTSGAVAREGRAAAGRMLAALERSL